MLHITHRHFEMHNTFVSIKNQKVVSHLSVRDMLYEKLDKLYVNTQCTVKNSGLYDSAINYLYPLQDFLPSLYLLSLRFYFR